MAGDDEARARAVLAEMQLRIAEGPTSALGIGEIVTPNDVRSAFLALTKQFHPARFGRLSPELQRLSNEVFLGIKAAHDHMLKVLGTSPAASRGGHRPSTGAIPIMSANAEGTARTHTPWGTQSIPRPDAQLARGTDRDGGSSTTALSTPTRPGTPPMGVPIHARTTTPATGSMPPRPDSGPTTGSIPTPPAGTPHRPTPVPPGTQPGMVPSSRQPPPPGGTQSLPRAVTPVPPGTQPGIGSTPPATSASQRMVRVRTSTGAIINMPAGQAPAAARPATLKPGETSPLARPGTLKPGEQTSPLARPGTLKPGERSPLAPPRSGDFNPPTVRNVHSPAPTQPIPRIDEFDEGAAFREAAVLMEQKNWTAARQALHALAAKVPQSKPYRAWLCYARGREAYIAGRPDDAILEMQRALQLEPDLAHAKHALAELQRRR